MKIVDIESNAVLLTIQGLIDYPYKIVSMKFLETDADLKHGIVTVHENKTGKHFQVHFIMDKGKVEYVSSEAIQVEYQVIEKLEFVSIQENCNGH